MELDLSSLTTIPRPPESTRQSPCHCRLTPGNRTGSFSYKGHTPISPQHGLSCLGKEFTQIYKLCTVVFCCGCYLKRVNYNTHTISTPHMYYTHIPLTVHIHIQYTYLIHSSCTTTHNIYHKPHIHTYHTSTQTKHAHYTYTLPTHPYHTDTCTLHLNLLSQP